MVRSRRIKDRNSRDPFIFEARDKGVHHRCTARNDIIDAAGFPIPGGAEVWSEADGEWKLLIKGRKRGRDGIHVKEIRESGGDWYVRSGEYVTILKGGEPNTVGNRIPGVGDAAYAIMGEDGRRHALLDAVERYYQSTIDYAQSLSLYEYMMRRDESFGEPGKAAALGQLMTAVLDGDEVADLLADKRYSGAVIDLLMSEPQLRAALADSTHNVAAIMYKLIHKSVRPGRLHLNYRRNGESTRLTRLKAIMASETLLPVDTDVLQSLHSPNPRASAYGVHTLVRGMIRRALEDPAYAKTVTWQINAASLHLGYPRHLNEDLNMTVDMFKEVRSGRRTTYEDVLVDGTYTSQWKPVWDVWAAENITDADLIGTLLREGLHAETAGAYMRYGITDPAVISKMEGWYRLNPEKPDGREVLVRGYTLEYVYNIMNELFAEAKRSNKPVRRPSLHQVLTYLDDGETSPLVMLTLYNIGVMRGNII